MSYSQQFQAIVEGAKEVIKSSISMPGNRTGFIIEDPTRPGKDVLTSDVQELFCLADNHSIVQLADTLQAARSTSDSDFIGRYRRLMLEIVTDVMRRLDLYGPFKLSEKQLAEANDPSRTTYVNYPIYTLPETGSEKIIIRRAGFVGDDVKITGRLLRNEPYLDLSHSIRKLLDIDIVRFAELLGKDGCFYIK